ncbi:MAG TPA: hypothetical protein VHU80_04540 [Polyangiaceae bacterium]|jgi:tellurite resistance protein|nr:hypothetical protein [Polyangiaceae bacterium]
MTPGEKNVLRSLVAVAWADGRLADGETGVIDGLLAGFDATDTEEAEILEYARTPRTLERDIPIGDLDEEHRELLLSNAALLVQIDGVQTEGERTILQRLIELLGFDPAEANAIILATRDGIFHGEDESLDD